MPATINTLPAKLRIELRQGARWTGVAVRFVDANGDPETLEVTGRVRTDTVDNGGVLLADCDVSSQDGDGYYTVSLDAAATRDLPQRQVFIEVSAVRDNATDPDRVMWITADVVGVVDEADPEPEP